MEKGFPSKPREMRPEKATKKKGQNTNRVPLIAGRECILPDVWIHTTVGHQVYCSLPVEVQKRMSRRGLMDKRKPFWTYVSLGSLLRGRWAGAA